MVNIITTVHLYQGPVGSNPGGKCILSPKPNSEHYIKYASGRRGDIGSLKPQHQPLYEALTLALAGHLGLKHVPYFALYNEGLKFTYGSQIKKVNEKMPWYFVSQICDSCIENRDDNRLEKIVAGHRSYLNLLLISDIINKPQNYAPTLDCSDVLYIDMGCTFINAVAGFVFIPPSKQVQYNRKDEKHYIARLQKTTIRKAGNHGDVNLCEFINSLGATEVYVFSGGKLYKRRIESLLNKEEMDYIRLSLMMNMGRVLTKHSEDIGQLLITE